MLPCLARFTGGVRLPWSNRPITTYESAAAAHGTRLEVVKLPEARCSFVQLSRRWVVERGFAWAGHFRRLARDYERLPETVVGLHFVVFACPFDRRLLTIVAHGP